MSSETKGAVPSLGESSRSCSPEKATSVSEFDKVFKPFVIKKDATLAPVNWFKQNLLNDVVLIHKDEFEYGETYTDCDKAIDLSADGR